MAIKLVFACVINPDGTLAFGKNNALPWGHEPVDLKFFKEQTQGTVLVMGANTWHSLPGKLPGRIHVVLTSDPSKIKGNPDHIVGSLADAIALHLDKDISVIGGVKLLKEALPYADTVAMGMFISNENIPADVYLTKEFWIDIHGNFKIIDVTTSLGVKNPKLKIWCGSIMEKV